MYTYLKGIVTEIESNYIALDVNGIGYLIYTPNPYSFNEVYNIISFKNPGRSSKLNLLLANLI